MKLIFASVMFILLVSPVAAYGQFRPATCVVEPLWRGGGVRSSYFGIMGAFEKNGSEGAAMRSFRLEGTQLIATVGIDFVSEYVKHKPRPKEVQLAITVSDKEEKNIFESVNSSEAKTQYAKKWNLSVTRNFNYDGKIYMISLRCWDAAGFAGKQPFY